MRVWVWAPLFFMASVFGNHSQAFYDCGRESVQETMGGYRKAVIALDNDLQRHSSAVKALVQPLQGLLEVAGGELAVTGRGIEGLGRILHSAFNESYRETLQGRRCLMKAAKNGKLKDGLHCLSSAGEKAITISSEVVIDSLNVIYWTVIKGSDVFFKSITTTSIDIAHFFKSHGLRSMALPFEVFPNMVQVGRWLVHSATLLLVGTGNIFVHGSSQLACNAMHATDQAIDGHFFSFTKDLFVGSMQVFVTSSDKLIEHLLVRPLNSIGQIFRTRAREKWDPPNGSKRDGKNATQGREKSSMD